jgi:hypothetical protein
MRMEEKDNYLASRIDPGWRMVEKGYGTPNDS